jgi:hypothetical protein
MRKCKNISVILKNERTVSIVFTEIEVKHRNSFNIFIKYCSNKRESECDYFVKYNLISVFEAAVVKWAEGNRMWWQ